MIRRNVQEAKQRSVDRRQREDDAPRLIEEVRRLASLDIVVDNGGNKYVWRIVVERAPALFELACPEESCTNGGHDLTRQIMQGLRMTSAEITGESTCRGDLPSGSCNRVVKYVASATYRDPKLVTGS
jgi:hypothetical protein